MHPTKVNVHAADFGMASGYRAVHFGHDIAAHVFIGQPSPSRYPECLFLGLGVDALEVLRHHLDEFATDGAGSLPPFVLREKKECNTVRN